MPTEPKTDRVLVARLKVAAAHGVSKEQARRQRVSFVYGNLSKSNSLTRHQVEQVLERIDG